MPKCILGSDDSDALRFTILVSTFVVIHPAFAIFHIKFSMIHFTVGVFYPCIGSSPIANASIQLLYSVESKTKAECNQRLNVDMA